MVAGRMVLRDRRVLNADEDAIRDETQRRADEVGRRVAADPDSRNMALLRAMAAGQL
jgi:hypothetical protein